MIAYSRRATKGLAYFWRPWNDIDIYVEDTAYTNMYKIMISNILRGKAKVNKLFPAGGKEEVLKICRECQEYSLRKTLFLVDGDLTTLTGEQVPQLKYLYQLSVHCAENLVVLERAITEVAFECSGSMNMPEIREELRFETWKKDVVSKMFPLYQVFAAAAILRVGAKSVSVNARALVDGTLPSETALSSEFVQNEKRRVEETCIESVGREEYEEAIQKVCSRSPRSVEEQFKILSGKYVLLPLLDYHLREKVGFRDHGKVLKNRLARYSAGDPDPGFAKIVKKVANE